LKTAVIIPAYNEEKRIAAVLRAVLQSEVADQVIVVSDGSTDRTAEVAEGVVGVQVERLAANRGKGAAMLHGARIAKGATVLLFLDADLIHLKPEHVCALLAPVKSGRAAMAIGQFKGGRSMTDLSQRLVSCISGQRAIRRDLFMEVPDLDRVGFGVELAITCHVKSMGYKPEIVRLTGVTHPMKEEKLGWFRGAAARSRMYWQMARFRLSYRFRGGPPKSGVYSKPPARLAMREHDEGEIVVGERGREKDAVDPVQNPSMSRKQDSEVLHSKVTL